MSKHDLAARPIYRHKRQSVEANLNILCLRAGRHHWIDAKQDVEHGEIRTRHYRTVVAHLRRAVPDLRTR